MVHITHFSFAKRTSACSDMVPVTWGAQWPRRLPAAPAAPYLRPSRAEVLARAAGARVRGLPLPGREPNGMTRLSFPSPEFLAQTGNETVKQGLIRIKGQHRVLESEGGGGIKVQMVWGRGRGRELSSDTDQVVPGGHEHHLCLLLRQTVLRCFPPVPPSCRVSPTLSKEGTAVRGSSAANGTALPSAVPGAAARWQHHSVDGSRQPSPP